MVISTEKEDMITVYSQGSFDLLHRGHINLLKKAKALGDYLIVSLLSDECYEAYRGYPPVMPFTERKAVIEELSCVDLVIEGDNTRTEAELLEFQPNYVVVGSDWAKKDIYKQYNLSQQWFDEHDITLLFIPYTQNISATKLKERICKQS